MTALRLFDQLQDALNTLAADGGDAMACQAYQNIHGTGAISWFLVGLVALVGVYVFRELTNN